INAKDQRIAQQNQEVSSKTNQATALQQIIDRHPSWNYKGPLSGEITWTAQLNKDKTVFLYFDRGKLVGAVLNFDRGNPVGRDSDVPRTAYGLEGSPMPAVPLVVQVAPVNRNVSVALSPAASNGWQRMVLRVDGKKGMVQGKVFWSVVN